MNVSMKTAVIVERIEATVLILWEVTFALALRVLSSLLPTNAMTQTSALTPVSMRT